LSLSCRTEDLEEKSRLSSSQNGLDLPDLKRTKSKAALSSPKSPSKDNPKEPPKDPPATSTTPGVMSLTYFAYANAPRSFENAGGASIGNAQAELAALHHASASAGGSSPPSPRATSSSKVESVTSSPRSSVSTTSTSEFHMPHSSSFLADISIQLPPTTLAVEFAALPPPPPAPVPAAATSDLQTPSATSESA